MERLPPLPTFRGGLRSAAPSRLLQQKVLHNSEVPGVGGKMQWLSSLPLPSDVKPTTSATSPSLRSSRLRQVLRDPPMPGGRSLVQRLSAVHGRRGAHVHSSFSRRTPPWATEEVLRHREVAAEGRKVERLPAVRG